MTLLVDKIKRLAQRYTAAAPEDAAAPTAIVRIAAFAVNTRRRSQALVRLAAAMTTLIDNLHYIELLQARYEVLTHCVSVGSLVAVSLDP
jgi:hypothetical protein